MGSTQLDGAITALAAAAVWGGGDFSGGMGVRATGGSPSGALRVVILAHGVSFAVLLVLCWLMHAPIPHGQPFVWSIAAGVTAAISLTAFYIALSRGAMGPSAAVSALLAASIPAVVSCALEGSPGPTRLAGFVFAGAAIWAIAASSAAESLSTMLLAIVGGIGFGLYFVMLRLSNPLGVLEPMAIARATSVVVCAAIFLAVRRIGPPSKLTRTAATWAMGVALLDTGGNILFIAATRMGRLDVAAVLASLYPASTILLAAWQLHERPTRRQLTGMALALVAVVLITL